MTKQEHYKMYDQYCWFKDPSNGYGLLTEQELAEMEMYDYEARAEQEAENAWLRKAESQCDPGFEQWEHSRLYS